MSNPKRPISTFEDLEVWKFGAELRRQISLICKSFPKIELYRLTDQLIRASRSITANIAEDYGRFHYQENIQYNRQARGSLYEILDHLIVAFEENYIDQSEYEDLRNQTITTIKLVNGYINYLKKSKTDRVKEDLIEYEVD
ncbi:MAG: four helix bundle protein [Balneola sp.]|nr:four helix bundle protein [Balneola sp.]